MSTTNPADSSIQSQTKISKEFGIYKAGADKYLCKLWQLGDVYEDELHFSVLHNVLHRVLPQAVVDRHCTDNTASKIINTGPIPMFQCALARPTGCEVNQKHLFCKTIKRRRLMHNRISMHVRTPVLVSSPHK